MTWTDVTAFTASSYPPSIAAPELVRLVGTHECPLILDVRREPVFAAGETMIAGALRRAPEPRLSLTDLPGGNEQVIVYCAHGHNVSQGIVARLRAEGVPAASVEGGLDGYVESGGPLRLRNHAFAATERGGSIWVTRRRPKVDRIACPWMIRRFIDPSAQFLFVEPAWVLDVAEETGGTAFDIEDAPITHRGPLCSFDDLIAQFGLGHEALNRLALIVRGADTASFHLAPEAAGLLALSLGLSARCPDDQMALEQGFPIYDALYAWARDAHDETHHWTGSNVQSAAGPV